VFSKASRKVREVRFFQTHLSVENLGPEVVSYYLSALLNAGRSVTYVLGAESARSASYDAIFDPWHATLPEGDRDLFDLLQALRDAEVHTKQSPSIEATAQPQVVQRPLYAGSNIPLVAQYLALGIWERDMVIEVPTYSFRVDDIISRHYAALFATIAANEPIEIRPAISTYADHLGSLVELFIATLGPPSAQ
jgi:hypothetical protein